MCFNMPTLLSHFYTESYICAQRIQAEIVFLVIPSSSGVGFFCFNLSQIRYGQKVLLDWHSYNLLLIPKCWLLLQWGALWVLWRPLFNEELPV